MTQVFEELIAAAKTFLDAVTSIPETETICDKLVEFEKVLERANAVRCETCPFWQSPLIPGEDARVCALHGSYLPPHYYCADWQLREEDEECDMIQ